MTHASRQPNLFDQHHTGANDGFIQADYAQRMPGIVRPKLAALLAEADAAEGMPWGERQEAVNRLLFHNMANWLPEPERSDLRGRFLAALKRLQA